MAAKDERDSMQQEATEQASEDEAVTNTLEDTEEGMATSTAVKEDIGDEVPLSSVKEEGMQQAGCLSENKRATKKKQTKGETATTRS